MSSLKTIGNVPFDTNVLSSIFPQCRHINEKAIALVESGKIIRLKKGLYVTSQEETGLPVSRFLVSNHLYGPSYVTQATALRYYGLIPERVSLIQAVTTKHSRDFENQLGLFKYQNCSDEYFHIGIRIIQEDGVNCLIATQEKALCDLINFSKGINLRFIKDVKIYLEEDIRFDTDALQDFDLKTLEECAKHSSRQKSIENLIKYIQNERSI